LLTFFMPQRIVMGDTTSDILAVRFEPYGNIDGNVSPEAVNFSSVVWGTNIETAFDFTLWNNGTVAMDSIGRQNTTTDEKDLTCAGAGAPTTDQYSIRITNAPGVNGNTNYINDVGNTVLDDGLAGSDSENFFLTLYLGPGSSNPGWQTTQINWTFSIS